MRVFPLVVLAMLLTTSALAASPSPAPSPAAAPERPGMAYIPAGEFLMGSATGDPEVYDHEVTSEQPQHPVTLKAFYIDKTEVTQKQFAEYSSMHQRDTRSACNDCPVTKVTWFDAKKYCEWKKKRLPTEAEWEKAAKGGTEERPKPLADYAWYNANSIQSTKPVGQKKPNGYGLHDMVGNVREWTNDWYDVDWYKKSPKEDPKGPESGTRKVERGGAFFLAKMGVTTTIRYNHPPTFTLYFLGFRCAQDP